VTDMPGEHPLPHPELHAQTPLIFTLKIGDVLYRHHQSVHDPIYFGMSGNYRLFFVHNGVGSEEWSSDGFTKL